MKNNEILLSVNFCSGTRSRNLSFLVLKDITMKSLVEGLYYGLKKIAKSDASNQEETAEGRLSYVECYELFQSYIKTHSKFIVLYTSCGENVIIDLTQMTVDPFRDDAEVTVYDCTLSGLGIVTSSCILITDASVIDNTNGALRPLFSEEARDKTYILREDASLEYNISTRRLNVIEDSEINIIPAGDVPKPQKGSFLDAIIPALITAVCMFGVRFLISKLSQNSALNNSMMLMTIAMPLVSLVTSAYNFKRKGSEFKQDSAEWKSDYENYITVIIRRIIQWQRDEISYLNNVYPSMGKLFDRVSEISSSIFSRSQGDKDFMKISLGSSDEIKPMFEIKSERQDSIHYDVFYRMQHNGDGEPYITIDLPNAKKKKAKDITVVQADNENRYPLIDLPYNFAHFDKDEMGRTVGFKYLHDTVAGNRPPLLVDLKNCGVLGVISKDYALSRRFVRHVAFELAYYHSPEDVQMVFFFNEEHNESVQDGIVSDYKYLPHTNELFDGKSQFVFDKESAGEAFSALSNIVSERARTKNDEEENTSDKFTQIVCVIFDDYDIKEFAFSKYLPDAPKEGEEYVNKLGLTFIYIQNDKGKLPKYCGSIIENDDTIHRISNRYNVLGRDVLRKLTEASQNDSSASTDSLIEYTNFENDFIFGMGSKKHPVSDYRLAYKQLSSIYYTRIAENGKVPSAVSLFEMYGYRPEMTEDHSIREMIRSSWNDPSNDVTRDLRVAMGKNDHGITYLDLHENADGPHMLVAGTTGSGKSETIITYLVGLAMKYSPMDLNILLVDMKGGGFSDRLGDLPHCVGTVTDTAGESEGISAVYMLKRFLVSLNAEIKKRKLILSSLKVDNADAYIRAYKKLKRIHDLEGDVSCKAERDELVDDIIKSQNEKQIEYITKDMSDLAPLSHLVLVVDEFTELKRFSSEKDDIDFIAEITTIARVGRTLGLHIILVSQNIEGAINDDIRVNTKSKICLKVATRQASKEMLGTTDAAAATMPGHGRAYLLVGTGSRYEYFQSAYTGASKNMNIDPTITITEVPNSGSFNGEFYISDKDNDVLRKKNKSSGTTQLKFVVGEIIDLAADFEVPAKIFRDPLPSLINDDDSIERWEGVVR